MKLSNHSFFPQIAKYLNVEQTINVYLKYIQSPTFLCLTLSAVKKHKLNFIHKNSFAIIKIKKKSRKETTRSQLKFTTKNLHWNLSEKKVPLFCQQNKFFRVQSFPNMHSWTFFKLCKKYKNSIFIFYLFCEYIFFTFELRVWLLYLSYS